MVDKRQSETEREYDHLHCVNREVRTNHCSCQRVQGNDFSTFPSAHGSSPLTIFAVFV